MPTSIEPPFFPIIFVRGYAGDQRAVEDAAADPYMGFNVYRDVYDAGEVLSRDLPLHPRSIFIYRYYERTSLELGTGARLGIEEAAAELGALIAPACGRYSKHPLGGSSHLGQYRVSH